MYQDLDFLNNIVKLRQNALIESSFGFGIGKKLELNNLFISNNILLI